MCTVPLPPGVNPIAVDKYIIYHSYQPTADKCKDGNLSQHANEVVMLETDCGAERVLLTNSNRYYSKWGWLTNKNE
jgi:hypothetical protein